MFSAAEYEYSAVSRFTSRSSARYSSIYKKISSLSVTAGDLVRFLLGARFLGGMEKNMAVEMDSFCEAREVNERLGGKLLGSTARLAQFPRRQMTGF